MLYLWNPWHERKARARARRHPHRAVVAAFFLPVNTQILMKKGEPQKGDRSNIGTTLEVHEMKGPPMAALLLYGENGAFPKMMARPLAFLAWIGGWTVRVGEGRGTALERFLSR